MGGGQGEGLPIARLVGAPRGPFPGVFTPGGKDQLGGFLLAPPGAGVWDEGGAGFQFPSLPDMLTSPRGTEPP